MNAQIDTSFDPTIRDPREFEYGLFIADTPAQGGATGFSWFSSDAEGLAYLVEQLPALYLDGDEVAEASQAIADAMRGTTELKALDLVPINTVFKGLCDIRWAGTFYDLESGKKPFELEIQADYRENIFAMDRCCDDAGELDYLACHLMEYNN